MQTLHIENIPSVVLLGNTGIGKSFLVEKLLGERGLSSDSEKSFTRCATRYTTNDIVIIDTPGANSMEDKLQHNLWIAQAFSQIPISLIILCVTADVRIDNTISNIRDYIERFMDFIDNICILVTKMDLVKWTRETFLSHLNNEFGIAKAVFSSIDMSQSDLLSQILSHCGQKIDININDENFLKYFKIHNNNIRILKIVRDEVTRFETISRQFCENLKNFTEDERIDLVFEFQSYMTNEIANVQARVIDNCKFSFSGNNQSNEYGHIANLTNQLKNVLFDVRTMALGYQSSHNISGLKKCPYCGEIWTKVAGCDGETTCGNIYEQFDSRFSIFATYTFDFDGEHFTIVKSGERSLRKEDDNKPKVKGRGCGKKIVWRDMTPVPVPPEFQDEPTICLDDVSVVYEDQIQSWHEYYEEQKSELEVKNIIRTKKKKN